MSVLLEAWTADDVDSHEYEVNAVGKWTGVVSGIVVLHTCGTWDIPAHDGYYDT